MTASSLGGVALWQRNQANEKSKLAQSRALVTQATSLASYQPDLAMLLAATAYEISPTREAIDALTSIASQWQHADRLLPTDMRGYTKIAFSPTDPTIVALTNVNGIEIRDVTTNTVRRPPNADGVGTSAFSPDGRIIAYTQNTEQGSKVVLWSHTEDLTRDMKVDLAPEESSGNLTFSSDGKLLGACVGRRIQLWSLDRGGPRYSPIPLIHDTACAFGFRHGSRELAYIDGDHIVTWDIAASRAATRKRPGPLLAPSPDNQFFFNKYSTFIVTPDGRSAVYSNTNGNGGAAWWDFDRQEAHAIRPGSYVGSVSFTPDSVAIQQVRDGSDR